MVQPAEQPDERFTYKEYRTWPDDERWELIDGVAYAMSPGPTTVHNRISVELTRQFANFLLGKTCQVFHADLDVRLPQGSEEDDEIDTVVQPDLAVVCDRSKIDKQGCKGAPDLIVEILSPSTLKKDLNEKLALYERAGVREYWVIHPTDKSLMIFKLDEQRRYGKPEVYGEGDTVAVGILEGLTIDLALVFAE